MKKFLIPLLLISVVLAGCGSNKVDFEKKQECANYKDEMAKEMQSNYISGLYVLQEIAYSPKTESCIYSIYDATIGTYIIRDFFSKQEIYSSTWCIMNKKTDICKINSGDFDVPCMRNICMNEYFGKIKELKGE